MGRCRTQRASAVSVPGVVLLGHGVSPGGTRGRSARRRARTARGMRHVATRAGDPDARSGPRPVRRRRCRRPDHEVRPALLRATAGVQKSRPESAPDSPSVPASRAGPRHQSRGATPGRRAARGLVPGDHLARAEEDGGGGPDRSGHEVEAPVHAVGEVDVGEPGRPEHRLGARRAPAVRVRPRVVRCPAYASTSVSRTTTPPRSTVQPSRSGATSSTSRAKNDLGSRRGTSGERRRDGAGRGRRRRGPVRAAPGRGPEPCPRGRPARPATPRRRAPRGRPA